MALFRFLLMLQVFMIVSAASDRISIFSEHDFFLVSRKFVTSKSIVAMDIVPSTTTTIYGHKGGLFPRTSKYIQYVDKNM